VSSDRRETRDFEEIVRQHRPGPVIALLDFVRCEDIERMMALGASHVLAKPFLLNDLLWQLGQLLDGTGKRRAVSRAA
jgi:CheY-like chemotaxis protein